MMLGSVSFLLIAATVIYVGRTVDYTDESGARGTEVVCAIIRDIGLRNAQPQFLVVGSDSDTIINSWKSEKYSTFLRRLSYVETLDGLEDFTFRPGYYGGIWQIDNETFVETQKSATMVIQNLLESAYEEYFAIRKSWVLLRWEELLSPRFSYLAATFHLLITENIMGYQLPITSEVSKQANFWKQHFNPNGNKTLFLERVNELEVRQNGTVRCVFDTSSCTVKADIVFVLDSSGSVGFENYQIVLEYVHNFTRNLTIGPDDTQVGVVIFGNDVETIFYLNTYTSESDLQNAIAEIPYLFGSATNTGGGLQEMIELFTNTSGGARINDPTVLRLAIVITDGRSNVGPSVNATALQVKNIIPAIRVFSIGVANAIEAELNIIATGLEYVSYLRSFGDSDSLSAIGQQQTFQACFRATLAITSNSTISNVSIGNGAESRFELNRDLEEGFTLRLCVHKGRVVLYVSVDFSAPNGAKHDLKATVDASQVCKDVVIAFSDKLRKRRQAVLSPTNTSDSVFIRIEGLDASNTYSLDIMEGVSTVVCDPPCGNGSCVANNTCSCDIGYDGALCTEILETECVSSTCLNGGRCYLEAFASVLCECTLFYTGDQCEFIIGTGTPPGQGNYTEKYDLTEYIIIVVSATGGGALIIIMIVIVVVTIVTRLFQAKLAERKVDQKIARGYEKMDKKVSQMYQNVVPEATNPSTALVIKNLYLPEENTASAYDLAEM